MEFRFRGAVKLGTTGALGTFGYVVACLQILGFAAGGFCVYGYLTSQPYCEKCSRYLSGKGSQIRYTGDGDGLQATAAQVLADISNGAIASAVERQRDFGTPDHQKDNHLRTMFTVRHCKKCGQHWVKFTVEKKSGDNWKEIPEVTVAGFTDQTVTI